MPCMPARRDFHTGRPNFLHRSWGPIEPFDDSVPQMLKEAGVHTHLATDHYHYFEEGGCNYHTRNSAWEFFRGQEGDPWFGQVGELERPGEELGRNSVVGRWHDQDVKNRTQIRSEADMPQTRTVHFRVREAKQELLCRREFYSFSFGKVSVRIMFGTLS